MKGWELPSRRFVPLVGSRSTILHGPSDASLDAGLSGRDVDCAVEDIYLAWPLRLTDGWRLCQAIHYDLRGWYWVIEREGTVIALDTIDDPRGLGRDAVRTGAVLEGTTIDPSPAVRGAYLTVKRIRKRSVDAGEWRRIATLAADDPDAYRAATERMVGARVARLVVPLGLAGEPPSPAAFHLANRRLSLVRFGSPLKAVEAFQIALRRYAERFAHATGLQILVVGPDGSGKSTVADLLPELTAGMFKREARIHWRPGFLPRPGSFAGKEPSDTSEPHARPPYGKVASVALLLYYWADWVLAGWPRLIAARARAGLMVVERGWWDIAVDPRRYRLDVSPGLVRALGAFVPSPDVALVLGGDPDILAARKGELAADEVARQQAAWREALPRRVPRIEADTSTPLDEMSHEIREAIIEVLERRAVGHLVQGWAVRGNGRWWLPRGPRRVAREALRVHHPTTTKGIVAWRAARAAAGAGAFRLIARGDPPPPEARAALAPHIPPKCRIAVARANHEGRYLAMVIERSGRPMGLAKIVVDGHDASPLEREAWWLSRYGPLLRPPLHAPRVLLYAPGIVIVEPVAWRPRRRSWRLDEGVASAMGEFFRVGARYESGELVGPAHGDLAPWNLLATRDGWALIDWESATDAAPPFHDLAHFFVQAHSLLGRPSEADVLQGFEHGTGVVGRAVRAYAQGADLPFEDAIGGLARYLERTTPDTRTATPSEVRGRERRELLLERLGG